MTPSFSYLLRNPLQWLAFGFGAGLLGRSPGTFGTLVAIPLYWFMANLPLAVYIAIVLAAFALGIYLCGLTARALNTHDHAGIVWDEIVGYWITMILAPTGWFWVALGFFLFRAFDIFKPWPIGWVDKRVHGGLGIMLDDVLAAAYAWVGLQLIALGVESGWLALA